MKFASFWLFAGVVAGLGNTTSLEDTASCVSACASGSLQAFQCSGPLTSCLCNDDALSNMYRVCLGVECSTDDQLAGLKFRATTCNLPTRNRQALITGVMWTLFSVATSFIIARAVSRWQSLNGAGYWWDDWTILMFYPLVVAITVSMVFCCQHGFGKDVWELTANEIEQFLFWFYIAQPLYMVVIFGCKISIVLLYIRAWADRCPTTFRLICWFMVGLISATIIGTTIATILQCIPISASWTVIVAKSNAACADRTAMVLVIAALNISYDMIVLAIPIPRLLRVKISWRNKIGLFFVCLVGFIVTICSCVRIRWARKFGNSDNVTYDYSYIGIWRMVEVYLSMTCACMPATAGVLRRACEFLCRGHIFDSSDTAEWESTISRHDNESTMEGKHASGLSDITLKPILSRKAGIAITTRELSAQPVHDPMPIVFQDSEHHIRFEVSQNLPSDPIIAKLAYVDRETRVRHIELKGQPPLFV